MVIFTLILVKLKVPESATHSSGEPETERQVNYSLYQGTGK